MHDHDHPSYDPLRRQIEALIRECDELRARQAQWVGVSEARAEGYRQAIADIAERTGCKTRPDDVSTLHELRDALMRELGPMLRVSVGPSLEATGYRKGYDAARSDADNLRRVIARIDAAQDKTCMALGLAIAGSVDETAVEIAEAAERLIRECDALRSVARDAARCRHAIDRIAYAQERTCKALGIDPSGGADDVAAAIADAAERVEHERRLTRIDTAASVEVEADPLSAPHPVRIRIKHLGIWYRAARDADGALQMWREDLGSNVLRPDGLIDGLSATTSAELLNWVEHGFARRIEELRDSALEWATIQREYFTDATIHLDTDPLAALVAAEEAYLRSRGWWADECGNWMNPQTERWSPRHVALETQRRLDREAGNG